MKTVLLTGDLLPEVLGQAAATGLVAWDIETSGLDWQVGEIGSCQIYIPGRAAYFLRRIDSDPTCLKELLRSPTVVKVFHHATFDLCFMAARWGVSASNVRCTKVASKVLDPLSPNHSLKTLVRDHFGVTLNKELATSNWFSERLSQEQMDYAVNDVLYLPRLLAKLQDRLMAVDRWRLAEACFGYIPTRVELELSGAGDVFKY